jgi:hypothetical protein
MSRMVATVGLCAVVGMSVSLGATSAAEETTRSTQVAQQTTPPETVWVVFHVKRGREETVKKLLTDSWTAYVRKGMVLREPHIIAHGSEEGGEYFLELLSWKSSDVPDNADVEIRALWKTLEDNCEARHGDSGIVFREIRLLSGPSPTANGRLP